MKLDVNALRYLTKDEFRVLTAVEMGMKNVRLSHLVPCPSQGVTFSGASGFLENDMSGHKIFLVLQHEIVPAELVDRIAGLKYLLNP